MSVEVTYNRRQYGNLSVTDTLGQGCDLYNAGDAQACLENQLNYQSAQYDFYSVRAPLDERLPGGGGYLVRGLSNRRTVAALPNNGQAVTLSDALNYTWNGVDTNVTLRARGGIRLNGGTSTGRALRDSCFTDTSLDSPQTRSREGNYYLQCRQYQPFQTNVRGSASYTIPWVDVLASLVFQYRPGAAINATVTYNLADILWDDPAAAAARPGCATNTVATCLYGATGNTVAVNVLDAGDRYGEGIRLFDLKLAKNIRFANRRLNIGVDVYNLFNSDGAVGYNPTYTTDPALTNAWGTVNALAPPRFARLQLQFDF
jgi:hypothetical protein